LVTQVEVDRRLHRLDAALTAMSDVIERIQWDEETSSYEDKELNTEAVRVLREVATSSRDVRALREGMSCEECEEFFAKSRAPELLKRFLGILSGLGESDGCANDPVPTPRKLPC